MNATARRGWRSPVGVILGFLSFVIYTGLVFHLPQVRHGVYCCEVDSIASAVSTTVYGTPIGTLDRNVYDYMRVNSQEPLNKILESLRELGGANSPIAPGERMPTTRDGNGVGYVLVATAAFRAFGMHGWALLLAMLALMALSSILFAWRFGAAFILLVSTYFTTLIVMLFSALLWNPGLAYQTPVAGIRYFSLLSMLPAFHILLDLLDRSSDDRSLRFRQDAALAVQVVVLAVALLVRASMGMVIAAIILTGLTIVWQDRKKASWRRLTCRKAAVIGISLLSVVVATALVLPQYREEGKLGTVFWHRVVISLGENPAFPFPGLRKMFPCDELPGDLRVPGGLKPGVLDQNGRCVFDVYEAQEKTPDRDLDPVLYSKTYEKVMREAFFKIMLAYPRDVLETFIYYKFRSIFASLREDLTPNFNQAAPGHSPPYSRVAIVGLVIALLSLLANFFVMPIPPRNLGRVGVVAVLCGACTIPPLIVIWAVPHTIGDLVFFCIFLAGLALSAVVQVVQGALRSVIPAGSRAGQVPPAA